MARQRKKYTLEFKQEAVRLVTEEGLTYAQVGLDLGVNKSTIRDWCKRAEKGLLQGSAKSRREESGISSRWWLAGSGRRVRWVGGRSCRHTSSRTTSGFVDNDLRGTEGVQAVQKQSA